MTIRRTAAPADSQRGITLIEQIMVLVLVAMLSSVAIPSMRRLLGRNQLQTAQTDFIAALRHAREVAVMSGQRTLFCPSRDGSSCGDQSRWDGGWLLAHDQDGDHQPDHDPLHVGPGYGGKLIIYSTTGRRYVRFSPDGSASGSNITLLFCLQGTTAGALGVIVSNAGRVRGAPADAAQAAQCVQAG
jgi:type IV fimbrial biogenesis protein FimT